jgi:predicted membrane-bound spermidine synthase
LEDFEHITDYRKNAAIVLVVMGSIIGFMLGVIVTLLMGINGNKSKAAKKKKKE